MKRTALRVLIFVLILVFTVACFTAPLVIDASAASARNFKIRNAETLYTVTKEANLTSSRYSLTNDFVLRKGSLTSLSTEVSRNIFGIRYYSVSLGDASRYGRADSFGKASSTVSSTLYQTTKSTSLLIRPESSANSERTLTKGTVFPVVGKIYNNKQKTEYLITIATNGNSNTLYYVRAKDATSNYGTGGNIRLLVTQYTQTDNTRCSGASIKTVLLYNRITSGTDAQFKKDSGACVGGIVTVLNKYLGSNTYRYNSYSSEAKYEAAIRESLANGKPVIVRVKIPANKYLKYDSNGHYMVAIGIEGKNLVLADPYNVKVGGTRYPVIPISCIFQWSKYNGKSAVYLIH